MSDASDRQASLEEVYAYARAWCRCMETSFLIQLLSGRETAIPFELGKGGLVCTLADLRGVLPGRFYALPRAPRGSISRDTLEGFCGNEIDARVPARA